MGQSEGQSNSAGPHWLVQPVPEPVLLLSLPTVLLPPTGADPEGIPESICCLLNSIAESASQENPTGSNAYRSSGDLVKMPILIKKKNQGTDLRPSVSNKLLGDADTADPRSHVEQQQGPP